MRSTATVSMLSLILISCSTAPSTQSDAAAPVRAVSDAYYAAVLNEMPEQAYVAGVALERHEGLSDKSPAWLAGWQKREDARLAALDAIDADALIGKPEWVTHGVLRESLAAWKDGRVGHGEWWMGVNQQGSWDTDLATLAELMLKRIDGLLPPVSRSLTDHASQRRGAVARMLHAARPDLADDRDARCHAHGSLQPDIRALTHQTN